MSWREVPKVDLHVHLEGTITPDMVKKLAAKNGLALPDGLFDETLMNFRWAESKTPAEALKNFLDSYQLATSVIKTADDYAEVTYDYLKRAAAENCIYAEITIFAGYDDILGISHDDMMAGIEQGYQKAKAETGIDARFIATYVRHFGPAAADASARVLKPHPLITGVGLAGDENAHKPRDFKKAYDMSGHLQRTAHAGEAAGPDSIRAARDDLKAVRFGHMVRVMEDKALIEEQKNMGAVAEVCISSNLFLKLFDSAKNHPLRRMYDAGLIVTLGSDDPTFFDTSIGREYQIAQEDLKFTDAELLDITKNAIQAAFVDEKLRAELAQKAVLKNDKPQNIFRRTP